jgi:sulfoxide reductase heme-binding subunit YedZ
MLLLHRDLRERFSTATAYVAIGLLAVTLSLGPLNVLRRRPNPVSFNLRRDFGIWSAMVGLVHSAMGLTVHFHGQIHRYFFADAGRPGLAGLRADAFGAANDSGLLAALLLLVLGLISNDLALRRLGTLRWRFIQRGAYVVAGLAVLHAALYQVIEKPPWWRILLVVAAFAALLTLQALGMRRRLQRSSVGANRTASDETN